jgi:predicted transcriptional regulator
MSTTDIKTAEWLEDIEIRAEYGSATHKYDIASALVAARKMRNLTQAALAKIAGVSQAYIAKLESGEANPTIGRIVAIFAAIWLKPHISIVPLVTHRDQDKTSSVSSIHDIYQSSVSEQLSMQSDLKNQQPPVSSSASKAAIGTVNQISVSQLGSVFGNKTPSLATL